MVARISPTNPVPHFLREWRVKKRLTQQQLADLLPSGKDGKPTGKDQISRWERNERGMTMDVQVALAQALGIEAPDLFRNPESRSSIDKMLDGIPPELADELHDEFERRVRSTERLIGRDQSR